MPEPDKSTITPSPPFTVGRYGGIYSWTRVPVSWWHWRALLSKVRHPVKAWRARREPRPDFVSYLGGELAHRSFEEYERLARETRAVFAGPNALFADTAEAEIARAAADASIFGAGYVGVDPFGIRRLDPLCMDISEPFPADPVKWTRDELLRWDHARPAPSTPSLKFGSYLAGVIQDLRARNPEPADGSPFFTTSRGSLAHPAHRDEIAARLADASVPCHACCGGPKSLGHEPGCEVAIRTMFASGRFDD